MKNKLLLVLLLTPTISFAQQPLRAHDPNQWLSTKERNEQLKSKLDFSSAKLLENGFFLIGTRTDTFDKVNLVWNQTDSSACTYNIGDSTLNAVNDLVNDPDSGWITVVATYFYYDDAKNDTAEIQTAYDEVNEIWVNTTRITYSYDGNGNVINNTRYSWVDSTSSWTKSVELLYDYDVNSNLIKYSNLSWVSSVFDTTYQEAYTYYPGNLLETATDYLWIPDKTPDLLATHYYNTADQDTQVVWKYWTGSTFKNKFMDTLIYDLAGNQLSFTRWDWHNNTTGFSLSDYRKEYTYDGSNRVTLEEDYYGDGDVNFFPLLLYKYEFDLNDNLSYSLTQTYNSSTQTFDNNEQTLYFYTDILSSVQSPSLPEFQCSVYPNPVGSSFKLKISVSDQINASIKITDVSGRVFKTISGELRSGDNDFEISAAGLSAGIYFIIISVDTQKTSTVLKLVKQ